MKQNGEGIGLKELVDGLLFSLQAEGRSVRTVEYYRDKLRLFLDYAQQKGWADSSTAIDAHRVREFFRGLAPGSVSTMWVMARSD